MQTPPTSSGSILTRGLRVILQRAAYMQQQQQQALLTCVAQFPPRVPAISKRKMDWSQSLLQRLTPREAELLQRYFPERQGNVSTPMTLSASMSALPSTAAGAAGPADATTNAPLALSSRSDPGLERSVSLPEVRSRTERANSGDGSAWWLRGTRPPASPSPPAAPSTPTRGHLVPMAVASSSSLPSAALAAPAAPVSPSRAHGGFSTADASSRLAASHVRVLEQSNTELLQQVATLSARTQDQALQLSAAHWTSPSRASAHRRPSVRSDTPRDIGTEPQRERQARRQQQPADPPGSLGNISAQAVPGDASSLRSASPSRISLLEQQLEAKDREVASLKQVERILRDELASSRSTASASFTSPTSSAAPPASVSSPGSASLVDDPALDAGVLSMRCRRLEARCSELQEDNVRMRERLCDRERRLSEMEALQKRYSALQEERNVLADSVRRKQAIVRAFQAQGGMEAQLAQQESEMQTQAELIAQLEHDNAATSVTLDTLRAQLRDSDAMLSAARREADAKVADAERQCAALDEQVAHQGSEIIAMKRRIGAALLLVQRCKRGVDSVVHVAQSVLAGDQPDMSVLLAIDSTDEGTTLDPDDSSPPREPHELFSSMQQLEASLKLLQTMLTDHYAKLLGEAVAADGSCAVQ